LSSFDSMFSAPIVCQAETVAAAKIGR